MIARESAGTSVVDDRLVGAGVARRRRVAWLVVGVVVPSGSCGLGRLLRSPCGRYSTRRGRWRRVERRASTLRWRGAGARLESPGVRRRRGGATTTGEGGGRRELLPRPGRRPPSERVRLSARRLRFPGEVLGGGGSGDVAAGPMHGGVGVVSSARWCVGVGGPRGRLRSAIKGQALRAFVASSSLSCLCARRRPVLVGGGVGRRSRRGSAATLALASGAGVASPCHRARSRPRGGAGEVAVLVGRGALLRFVVCTGVRRRWAGSGRGGCDCAGEATPRLEP